MKITQEKWFQVDGSKVSIQCEVFVTRTGWGHIARAWLDGSVVGENKVNYQNRTWEAYQFDSVKSGLMSKLDESKSLSLSERRAIALAINCNY